MRLWGQIAEAKTDSWYADTAKAVFRPDLYLAAAKSLVDEGKMPASAVPETDGYKTYKPAIDGKLFDGKMPNAYLEQLAIGLKGSQTVTAAGVK